MTTKGLVTVTGASGFIAQHTIKQLLDAGYSVRGTVRNPSRIEALTAALALQCDVVNLSFVVADLTDDAGWQEAMEGADYLLHMASPLPIEQPNDENDLIIPAREGALRALKAAAEAGISRIVMTSSIASIYGGNDDKEILTEKDWSDATQNIGAYPKSKTLAERAAWDFINALPAENRPELTVINPGYVLGPLIDSHTSASHEVLRRPLAGKVPGIPNIGFNFVDVRDVAAAHVAAMTSDIAPGNRYVCVTGFLSYRDVATELSNHVGSRGYKIPLRAIPDWLVRTLALFNPTLRIVVSRLGKSTHFDNSQIHDHLGWTPMNIKQSIRETADSLIEHRIV